VGHPNETALRRLYESFLAGDPGPYKELVEPTIVWHEPGDTQISGGTYRDELVDVIANDRYGIALVRHHLERDGETFNYALAQVWRIDDGKFVEYWEYPEPDFYRAWR
jgi:ketosteroid isomerase-like protein